MKNSVIVIPCFNKTKALTRLLDSLLKANYPENVKLIFSVDFGGDDKVLRIVENFNWPFGEKEIILHEVNIGLRENILSCGALSKIYGSVIVLEDDSYVAASFYEYALKAMNFYDGDDNIAGVSLYAYEYSEVSKGRFYPLYNDEDSYFMQWASSRGQLWTETQWNLFKKWYENHKDADLTEFNVPSQVTRWTAQSWKKYFITYLVDTGRFFSYPYVSFVSNCGDAGTHCAKGDSAKADFIMTQVPLPNSYQVSKMTLAELSSSLVKYDAFFEIFPAIFSENELLSGFEFDVDISGVKRIENSTKEYVLSSKPCSKPIVSFGSPLLPLESNIINNTKGKYLSLGRIEDFNANPDVFERLMTRFVNRETLSFKAGLDFLKVKLLTKFGLDK